MIEGLKLRVEGKAVNDPYVRYYGLGIDQPLYPRFWSTQSHKVRGVVAGSFAEELDIPNTTTYVVVGISAYVGYWTVRVYVDGKLIGEKNCAVPDAYPGSPGYPRFDVAAPKVTLGLALTLLGALTPIIFSLSVVAFSELKKLKYI